MMKLSIAYVKVRVDPKNPLRSNKIGDLVRLNQTNQFQPPRRRKWRKTKKLRRVRWVKDSLLTKTPKMLLSLLLILLILLLARYCLSRNLLRFYRACELKFLRLLVANLGLSRRTVEDFFDFVALEVEFLVILYVTNDVLVENVKIVAKSWVDRNSS